MNEEDSSFSSVGEEITQALRKQQQTRIIPYRTRSHSTNPNLLRKTVEGHSELDRLSRDKIKLGVELEQALQKIESLYDQLLTMRKELQSTRIRADQSNDLQFKLKTVEQEKQRLKMELKKECANNESQFKVQEAKMARLQHELREQNTRNQNLMVQLDKLYEKMRAEAFERTRQVQEKTKIQELSRQLQSQIKMQDTAILDIKLKEQNLSVKSAQLERDRNALTVRLQQIQELQSAMALEKKKLAADQARALQLNQFLERQKQHHRSFKSQSTFNNTMSNIDYNRLSKQLYLAQDQLATLKKQLNAMPQKTSTPSSPLQQILREHIQEDCDLTLALKSALKFIKAIEDMLLKLGRGSRKGRWGERLKLYWKQIKALTRHNCN